MKNYTISEHDSQKISGLIEFITAWANEKGILEQGDVRAQANKTAEEAEELDMAIYFEEEDKIKEMGDKLEELEDQGDFKEMISELSSFAQEMTEQKEED